MPFKKIKKWNRGGSGRGSRHIRIHCNICTFGKLFMGENDLLSSRSIDWFFDADRNMFGVRFYNDKTGNYSLSNNINAIQANVHRIVNKCNIGQGNYHPEYSEEDDLYILTKIKEER